MKTVKVSIKGVSPLLMHSYPMVTIEGLEKKTPEEQAEISAYRDVHTQELYIPAVNLQRSLVSAATYSKGKGRASLQKLVAAGVAVSPVNLTTKKKTFEVDARSVVIPATKGRVIRYRPRLDEWAVDFELEYDDTLMDEKSVRKVVDDAGSRVGVLDFRPEKKGPFGRFIVTNWVA